jgi:hypothetical protein
MSTNLQPPNRTHILVLLFAAIGIPVISLVALFDKVNQNPRLALIVALIYELLLIVIGFISKVWQILENRWAEPAADWVDTRGKWFIGAYRKHYLQYLLYKSRDFDVKGLSTQGKFTLEVERVFVELSVSPQAVHQASANLIPQIPEELREGHHPIWEYLIMNRMSNHNLAIIGPPGSGKTTLLKHLALNMIAGKKRNHHVTIPWKIPILLFLRKHAKAIGENPNLTLAQLVREQSPWPEDQTFQRWIASRLQKGKCLVMLDGLDEVADPKIRQAVVDWVERQMADQSANRFIITSRPHGYRDNPLGGVAVLEVRPFNRGQIRSFVHNWYLANEIMSHQKDDPGVRMAARDGAEDLLRRLESTPSLAELAVNPLLLTMIATVHRFRSSLPGRRVELYAEICEVCLGKRQAAREIESDLTPAQKQRVLQPLAYYLMCEKKREIGLDLAISVINEPLKLVSPKYSGEEFLKMVENSSGLLVEREIGIYGFAHHTFQEYLAAVHILEQRMGDDLAVKIGESWWHEVIRLYAARADATKLVAACLVRSKTSVPALTLAIECLEEAREVQPALRTELQTILEEGVEDENPERRWIVAEALLALRLGRMIKVAEDQWVDTSCISHAEYQLFLDEKRAAGQYHQPDHWKGYQFPPGQGRMSVVGVRPSDAVAFCEWLTHRDPEGRRYRLPNASEHSGEEVACLNETIGLFGKKRITGYWVISGQDIWCERSGDNAPAISLDLLQQWLSNDFVLLDRTLNFDLARVLDLERAIARAHGLNLDRVHTLERAYVHAHVLDRALDYVLVRVIAGAFELHLDRARALDRALAQFRSLNRNSNLVHDLVRDLGRERDTARFLVFSKIKDFYSELYSVSNCSIIRMMIILIVIDLLYLQNEIVKSQSRLLFFLRRSRYIKIEKEKIRILIDFYLDKYISLAILEERIEGKLPAFEGIRIVRETEKIESKK